MDDLGGTEAADLATDIARKHGVSLSAVQVLQDALRRGGGRQAQFSHPDLGGMGQWSAGGMTQIGDMFNTALRAKVNALCTDLVQRGAGAPAESDRVRTDSRAGDWWPDRLGRPSATGSQNGIFFYFFA